MSPSDQRTNSLLCSALLWRWECHSLGVSQEMGAELERPPWWELLGPRLTAVPGALGKGKEAWSPPCVDLRWRLGHRDFPKPSLWCSVSSSVGVLQAPDSEMPIIILNMIRMCIPGTGCFLPGSFPAQGGSKQGNVLLIFFFFLYKLVGSVDGSGGKRTEHKLAKNWKSSDSPTS